MTVAAALSGAVTYPANDPVNKTLRSFQVDLSGNPPLADILKQQPRARASNSPSPMKPSPAPSSASNRAIAPPVGR